MGVADPEALVHCQLTTRFCKVVLSFEQDQASCRSQTIYIIVTLEYAVDEYQLTICSKVVGALCQQVVGLVDLYCSVGHCLCCTVNVVVVAIDQNQAGSSCTLTVLVVVQCAVFIHYCGIQDHLTICCKAVIALCEGKTIGLGNPSSLVSCCDCTTFNAVVILSDLHQTGIVDSSTILIVVQRTVLIDHFGGHNDLTISCETVGTGR